jgi:predicted HicB family RNase H-like nuclease
MYIIGEINMNKTEFTKKLKNIEKIEPDEIDTSLLKQAEKEKADKTVYTGADIDKIRAEQNGQILLRVPKTLQAKLKQQAKLEGVSLNQFCLYKLSSAI